MLHAIAASDFHLEKLKRLFPTDHIERQLCELEKIYQYAIDNGIEHVFIPGDISDTAKMEIDTYIELVMFFKKYDDLVNTYYIGGNHDFSDISKTSMDLLKVLTTTGYFKRLHISLKPEQLEIEGVQCSFLPHPRKKGIKSARPCLNFAHVEYDGAVNDTGRKMRVKNEIKVSKKDFTISGHIHQYQYMENKRALFVGNPYQTTFGEALPKGFVEFRAKESKGKIDFKHKFIDNKPGFILQTITIEKQKDFAKLSDDRSIKYRLYIDNSLTIPEDLTVRFPNVMQIRDLAGKVLLEPEGDEEFTQDLQSIPQIDPLFGLKEVMKSEGFKKADYNSAIEIVHSVLSELGYVA